MLINHAEIIFACKLINDEKYLNPKLSKYHWTINLINQLMIKKVKKQDWLI